MILAVTAAFAADDPGGWTKAKWGMTETELLAAFPQATRLDPPEKVNHSRVHIPTFDLAGARFHIYFTPDEKGSLNSVLFLVEAPPVQGIDRLFQDLESLLVEKYGHPWTSTEDHTTKIQWSLKTTTIVLSRTNLTNIGMQLLNLQYKRKDPDLDKM